MFRTLNAQLIIPIAAAISVGLLALVVFFTLSQQRNILLQNERSVLKVTDSIVKGLQTVMLAGYADVAELYVERLQAIGGVVDFRILRSNGVAAFKDNETIRRVNKSRGEDIFATRDSEEVLRVLPADFAALNQVLTSKRFVTYYENAGGDGDTRTLTFLWPILNEKACRKCHGSDHEIRGVVKFSTSLKTVDESVARTWQTAFLITAAALIAIVFAMYFIVRYWVIAPVLNVSSAMRRTSDGDLSQTIPVIGHDELAGMAVSFNTMLRELRETYLGFKAQHNKLTTVIQGSNDGIVVTDSDERIALVNEAALKMLGKDREQLVAAGFDQLFDDPLRLRRILQDPSIPSETIDFNGRVLIVSAAAIYADDGRLIGNSATLRDVSEEKRLERVLRTLSDTDALTGLPNRRLLDDTLDREMTRCFQHGHALSILMFDVDHFKRFNDTYGHDQGDRVLRHVASAARNCVRTIDLPCRYGGEEFLVILIETAADRALVVAERLREAVAALRVDGLQVTATIGVAGLAETGARTPDELIACADAAMYAGKRAGRNRVVCAQSAPVAT